MKIPSVHHYPIQPTYCPINSRVVEVIRMINGYNFNQDFTDFEVLFPRKPKNPI